MPYSVYKEGKNSFRIVMEIWKDGKRERHTVPKRTLSHLKDYEAALAWVKARNAGEKEERSKVRAAARLRLLTRQKDAFLPEHFVAEFESIYVPPNTTETKKRKWRTAYHVMERLKIPVGEFFARREEFYTEFVRVQYSGGFVTDLLRWINLWGEFLSFKLKIYREVLPKPSMSKRAEINRRFYQKWEGWGRAARPLTWAHLRENKEKFTPEEFAWMQVSLAFGLRPEEMEPKCRKVISDLGLHVLQLKLIKKGLPEKKCWKLIPLTQPEQREAIKLLGIMKRPTRARLRRFLGKGYAYYSGRKGFAPWLRKQCDVPDHKISRWLGHMDSRTLRLFYDTYESDAPTGS